MIQDIHGILLLDKPLGLTSAAAVARVKRLFAARKAGHMGSLDPLASGLLVVGLGEATKFGAHLLEADKTYRASVRLGERTPSADQETPVCERAPVPSLDFAQMQEQLAAFPRRYEQIPPMHSALKKDGKPLYVLARGGHSVARPAREVSIHELRLLAWEPPELHLEVTVSKGTYVRVLAEDIARRLSTLGHLSSLRRVTVAPFSAPRMHALAALEIMEPVRRHALLLPMDSALEALPSVTVDAAGAGSLAKGRAIPSRGGAAGTVRIYGPEGSFLGLGTLDPQGVLRPHRLLAVPDN